MGEVARAHNRDTFSQRPPGKMAKIAVLAARAGETGVDVGVCVEHATVANSCRLEGKVCRGAILPRATHPRPGSVPFGPMRHNA